MVLKKYVFREISKSDVEKLIGDEKVEIIPIPPNYVRQTTEKVKAIQTEENILEWIRQADIEQSLKEYIVKKWDEKIDDILSVVPMIPMFVKGEQLAGVRDKVAETFSGNAAEFLQLIGEQLVGKIDIQETIEKNILAFDLKQLESIIEEIAHKEFRYIERLGGVLGFFIGAVQAVFIWALF